MSRSSRPMSVTSRKLRVSSQLAGSALLVPNHLAMRSVMFLRCLHRLIFVDMSRVWTSYRLAADWRPCTRIFWIPDECVGSLPWSASLLTPKRGKEQLQYRLRAGRIAPARPAEL